MQDIYKSESYDCTNRKEVSLYTFRTFTKRIIRKIYVHNKEQVLKDQRWEKILVTLATASQAIRAVNKKPS